MTSAGRSPAMRADHPPVAAKPWSGDRPPERVLAIRLQALGDTILTLPYLHALRRRLPGVTLDFLTRREVADIPKNVDLFDRVFEIGGGRNYRLIMLGALARVPSLWMRRYDVVVDLQRNRISRTVRALLSPRAWSEFDRYSPRLAGERTRATIEAVGLGPLEVRPDLAIKRTGAGSELLRATGWDGTSELIVLNPAGSFAGRRWPVESYARFAELWLESVSGTTQFVVLGLPAIADRASYLQERLGDRLLDLVGRTSASEAFELLGQTALVLSEDSGLMHMAWVSGAPTLALFGASYSVWARPHGNYTACVRTCRRGDGHCLRDGECEAGPPACLEGVVAETVVERARELLDRVARQPKVIYGTAVSHRSKRDGVRRPRSRDSSGRNS